MKNINKFLFTNRPSSDIFLYFLIGLSWGLSYYCGKNLYNKRKKYYIIFILDIVLILFLLILFNPFARLPSLESFLIKLIFGPILLVITNTFSFYLGREQYKQSIK